MVLRSRAVCLYSRLISERIRTALVTGIEFITHSHILLIMVNYDSGTRIKNNNPEVEVAQRDEENRNTEKSG